MLGLEHMLYHCTVLYEYYCDKLIHVTIVLCCDVTMNDASIRCFCKNSHARCDWFDVA